jgi:hypothetical protein
VSDRSSSLYVSISGAEGWGLEYWSVKQRNARLMKPQLNTSKDVRSRPSVQPVYHYKYHKRISNYFSLPSDNSNKRFKKFAWKWKIQILLCVLCWQSKDKQKYLSCQR